METDSVLVYVPPAGLNVGATTLMVYVALVTLLLLIPLAAAIALSVVVVVSGTGPVYALDAVVGALRTAAWRVVAPLVEVLIVTATEPTKVPPGGLNVGGTTMLVFVSVATV